MQCARAYFPPAPHPRHYHHQNQNKPTNQTKKICSLLSFGLGLSPISTDLLFIQPVALLEGGRGFRLQERLEE